MGLVFLLTRGRERGGMLAPTAVRVLGVHEPVCSTPHRFSVPAELHLCCAQAQQDLACIEGDRNHRRRIDLPALKTSARQLDADQPVRHAAGTFPVHRLATSARIVQEGVDDVARGLGVGRRPALDQAVVPRHAAVGREGAVLCKAEPPHQRSEHALRAGVFQRQPGPIAADFCLRCGRQQQARAGISGIRLDSVFYSLHGSLVILAALAPEPAPLAHSPANPGSGEVQRSRLRGSGVS